MASPEIEQAQARLANSRADAEATADLMATALAEELRRRSKDLIGEVIDANATKITGMGEEARTLKAKSDDVLANLETTLPAWLKGRLPHEGDGFALDEAPAAVDEAVRSSFVLVLEPLLAERFLIPRENWNGNTMDSRFVPTSLKGPVSIGALGPAIDGYLEVCAELLSALDGVTAAMADADRRTARDIWNGA